MGTSIDSDAAYESGKNPAIVCASKEVSMRHTARDVLGQAPTFRRSCEILPGQPNEIGGMVMGTEQLIPIQETEIANANQSLAEYSKDHIERADQYIRDWQYSVVEALSTEPSWLR